MSKQDNTIINVPDFLIIDQHLQILVLRKSVSKLREYIACFSHKKYAIRKIIEIKYNFSKCRPEVLAILEAMAKDPKRFEFESTNSMRKVLRDSKNGTRFMLFDYTEFSHRKKKYNLTINYKEFLTENETVCMASIIQSMHTMQKNEYALQAELQLLEEQNSVFELYQTEKLSTR